MDERPSLLTYGALRDLPIPVQVALTALLLPYEAVVTSIRLLKVTEELLGELVMHLRALRPAVATVSQAYADGHFDPVLRGLNQLQQSTDAIAYAWSPLTSVRDAVIPGQARRAAMARPAPPNPAPVLPPAPLAPPSPTMAEWIGELRGRAWGQAVGLPGFVARQLRPDEPCDPAATAPLPARPGYPPPEPVREGALGPAGHQDTPGGGLPLVSPVLDLARPLIPDSVRKLFGG
jgi:hypothetical protein